MFQYPESARFGEPLPKSKIYAFAKPSSRVKSLFVSQVDRIHWSYKLSPETINLPARASAPEIQVLTIHLKSPEWDEALLTTIDRAIRFPTLYELRHDDQIAFAAAYKRPGDGTSTKWVVEACFTTEWSAEATVIRESLPTVIDLGALYEAILRRYIPLPARKNEALRDHVARISAIRAAGREVKQLERRLRSEKQFNRKVELNARLRLRREELDSLCAT